MRRVNQRLVNEVDVWCGSDAICNFSSTKERPVRPNNPVKPSVSCMSCYILCTRINVSKGESHGGEQTQPNVDGPKDLECEEDFK